MKQFAIILICLLASSLFAQNTTAEKADISKAPQADPLMVKEQQHLLKVQKGMTDITEPAAPKVQRNAAGKLILKSSEGRVSPKSKVKAAMGPSDMAAPAQEIRKIDAAPTVTKQELQNSLTNPKPLKKTDE